MPVTVQETIIATAFSTVVVSAESTIDVTRTSTVSTLILTTTTSEVTVTPQPTCGVNLIKDPSFESSSVGDWTIDYGGEGSYGYNLNGYDGAEALTLSTYNPGYGFASFAQTVATVVGNKYQVSIWTYISSASGNNDVFTCTSGEGVLFSYNLIADGYSGWHQLSGSFTASMVSERITCTLTSTEISEILVDDVIVEC